MCQSYLLFKLNVGGVMLIIFVLVLIFLLVIIVNFIKSEWLICVVSVLNFGVVNFWLYVFMFFVLILGFFYFYVFFMVNFVDIVMNLKWGGVVILGVCFGSVMVIYFLGVQNCFILLGGLFFGVVVIIFVVVECVMNVQIFQGFGVMLLLIFVGVVIDMVKQVQIYVIL